MNLPKKGLVLAHLNVCSLRNKVHELCNLVESNNIHIFAISETHLDSSFEDSEVAIHGYNLFRRDRDKYGGGVTIYVQNNIPAKKRCDLMLSDIEALWLQIHLPHLKPILVGCYYRPPMHPPIGQCKISR